MILFCAALIIKFTGWCCENIKISLLSLQAGGAAQILEIGILTLLMILFCAALIIKFTGENIKISLLSLQAGGAAQILGIQGENIKISLLSL